MTTESTGTPASISPPSSPPLSTTSDDINARSTSSRINSSICRDASCYECVSARRFKDNVSKLRTAFPLLTYGEIESTLERFRGDYGRSLQYLTNIMKTPTMLYEAPSPQRPCSCFECTQSLSQRRDVDLRPSNKKRAFDPMPRLNREYPEYSPLSKRKFLKETVQKNDNKLMVVNISKDVVTAPPPLLIKYCAKCSSSIPVDDRFCGKCGLKQVMKTE